MLQGGGTKRPRPEDSPYFGECAVAIRDALQKHKLSDWGFVIVRCTYSPQEEWDKFLALAKGHARDYFAACRMEAVHDRMRWTVIEDAAAQEGADILAANRRFVDWADRGPGMQEWQGTAFTPTRHYSPRYDYFVLVDEESLESVMDGPNGHGQRGYFCKVVNASGVLLAEREREKLWDVDGAEQEGGGLVDEEDLEDLRKQVKIDTLVSVYAMLQLDLNCWYELLMNGDIVVA